MINKVIAFSFVVLLGGCTLQLGESGEQMLSDASSEEYAKSECAKWIAVPPNADKITAFGFFGRDTNYRFLKCTLGQADINLANLIALSLEMQPRKTNDTFVLVNKAHITPSGFKSVFGLIPSSSPSWWTTDLARFDQQSFCAWQSTNDFGCGYIYLFDPKQRELRAFQWSQQWNTAIKTKEKLQK